MLDVDWLVGSLACCFCSLVAKQALVAGWLWLAGCLLVGTLWEREWHGIQQRHSTSISSRLCRNSKYQERARDLWIAKLFSMPGDIDEWVAPRLFLLPGHWLIAGWMNHGDSHFLFDSYLMEGPAMGDPHEYPPKFDTKSPAISGKTGVVY